MAGSDDFYEEDEPVGDVVAAFESGDQGVTSPPLSQYVESLEQWVLPISVVVQNEAVRSVVTDDSGLSVGGARTNA